MFNMYTVQRGQRGNKTKKTRKKKTKSEQIQLFVKTLDEQVKNDKNWGDIAVWKNSYDTSIENKLA